LPIGDRPRVGQDRGSEGVEGGQDLPGLRQEAAKRAGGAVVRRPELLGEGRGVVVEYALINLASWFVSWQRPRTGPVVTWNGGSRLSA
jgi:hypothetical protein